MTKFKPILFSTPMVEAINENRKSQTRRVIKHHCEIDSIKPVVRCLENEKEWGKFILTDINGEDFLINPFAEVGEILWVRENFYTAANYDHWKPSTLNSCNVDVYYAADIPNHSISKPLHRGKNRPCIFLPFEYARLFLKVKAIRVEPLQDISTSDIKSEGVVYTGNFVLGKENNALSFLPKGKNLNTNLPTESEIFFAHWAELWCKINGLHSWSSNPFVWVIEFERIKKPQDFI